MMLVTGSIMGTHLGLTSEQLEILDVPEYILEL